MKLRTIALLLLLAGGLALAPAAFAEEEGEKPQDDLKKRIKKQMERILELMEKNESALLKLSSGTAAKTRTIDIPVPEGEKAGATGSKAGAAAGSASASGKEAAEALAELVRAARKDGGMIPDELKKLVEMIPL